MTPRQLEAHKTGILARATTLHTEGVPFDDYRVGHALDAAILLGRQGCPRSEWEPIFDAILTLYGQPIRSLAA